jgi:hypothetical protein
MLQALKHPKQPTDQLPISWATTSFCPPQGYHNDTSIGIHFFIRGWRYKVVDGKLGFLFVLILSRLSLINLPPSQNSSRPTTHRDKVYFEDCPSIHLLVDFNRI